MAGEWCIAVAQTLPVAGDVQANLRQHLQLARAAAERSVGMLVFPELSLTGYELQLGSQLAFAAEDPRLHPLRQLAVAHGLTLVVSAPVRVASKLHIAALILFPDNTVGIYAKQHLGAFSAQVNPGGAVPPAETSVFDAGTASYSFELENRTVALAICSDTGRAEHARAAASAGASAYLASMFSIPSDYDADRARLAAYAEQHRMLVAMANYGGSTGGLPAAGRSGIWSPRGELLAELGGAGLGLAIARQSVAGWRGEAIPLDLEAPIAAPQLPTSRAPDRRPTQ